VTIEIQSNFQKQWKIFYYSLTTVGKYSQVYVKHELKGNKFTIATADAEKDVEVHWSIKGEG